jgi:hypothetical protein
VLKRASNKYQGRHTSPVFKNQPGQSAYVAGAVLKRHHAVVTLAHFTLYFCAHERGPSCYGARRGT